jgi:hypothetical protein
MKKLASLLFVGAGFSLASFGLFVQDVSVAVAQDKANVAPDDKDIKNTDQKATKKTLFLLARVGRKDNGNQLSPNGLEQNFTMGLDKTKCKYAGKVLVKAISPSVFRNINKIVAGATDEPWKATLPNGVTLLHAEIEDSLFLAIRMPKEIKSQLEWIEIEATGAEEKSGKYGSGEGMKPLSLLGTSPTTYSIPWALNAQITKVKMKILELDGQNKASSSEKEFPLEGLNSDLYYSLTVKDFEGDKQKLFDFVQDPINFEDVIQIGADMSEYVVQMASMGVLGGGTGPGFDDKNNWMPMVSQNSKGNVERAWVLFPLTKDQAEAELKKFDKKDTPFDAYKKFAAMPNKVTANMDAKFKVGSPAQWYELPKGVGFQLTRPIDLGDLKDFFDNQKDFEMLVVRERQLSKDDKEKNKMDGKENEGKQLVRDEKDEFANIIQMTEKLRSAVKAKLDSTQKSGVKEEKNDK